MEEHPHHPAAAKYLFAKINQVALLNTHNTYASALSLHRVDLLVEGTRWLRVGILEDATFFVILVKVGTISWRVQKRWVSCCCARRAGWKRSATELNLPQVFRLHGVPLHP